MIGRHVLAVLFRLNTFACGEILEKGEADQIALARAFLDNPRWGWHAADALGVDLKRPPQYDRARKALWPGEALKRH